MDKKIGIATDHAGYQMKELITGYLDSLGYDVHDFGCHDEESCDYPDFGHALGESIDKGELTRGIALCGSANGINMVVNKHQAVRGAVCWNANIAKLARQHNDANVCSIPARMIDNTEAINIVDQFLNTPFEGGRHQLRADKIAIKK